MRADVPVRRRTVKTSGYLGVLVRFIAGFMGATTIAVKLYEPVFSREIKHLRERW